MKKIHWEIKLAFGLVVLSALLYSIHLHFFHDLHHILIYLMGDIAFVPIEVLLVTLVLHRWLAIHEKKAIMHKLNMVIGTFYSELGSELLAIFAQHDPHRESISTLMMKEEMWTGKQFFNRKSELEKHVFTSPLPAKEIEELKTFLSSKRAFILELLGNPNLLEHAAFTDTLWAVFHLTEELCARETVDTEDENDYSHLKGDIHRAYKSLTEQWICYMHHLKESYPYIYSLALRKNPFNPKATAIVTK